MPAGQGVVARVACVSTKCTNIWAKAAIPNPIKAYIIVFLAVVMLVESPPEVMYFSPPTMTIITAANPTTILKI